MVEKWLFSKAESVLGLAPNRQKAIQDLASSNELVKAIIKEGQEVKGSKELNFWTMTVLVFWYKLQDTLLDFTQKMGEHLSIFTQIELHNMNEDCENDSTSTIILIFYKDNNE